MTGRGSERRWLILGEDGRHVWMGRHTDPTEEEILTAEALLAAQSISGWLAVSNGDYWSRASDFRLLPVRPLANPSKPFDEAANSFLGIRLRRLSQR